MANRQQKLLLEVQTVLEKAQMLKEANEVSNLLKDVTVNIDLDSKEFEDAVRKVFNNMSKEAMEAIGKGFNGALELLGKKGIDIEKYIKMPNDKMWEELGNRAGNLVGKGLSKAIRQAVNNVGAPAAAGSGPVIVDTKAASKEIEELRRLMKEKHRLEAEEEKYNEKVRQKNEAISRVNKHTTEKSPIDETYGKRARAAVDNFVSINLELEEAIENEKVTEQLLKKWMKASNEVDKIYNSIYDVKSSTKTKESGRKYFDKTTYDFMFDEKYGKDAIQLSGADYIEEFFDSDEFADEADRLRREIKKINIDISKLTEGHPELISEKATLEAEQRLIRIQNEIDRLNSKAEKQKTREITSINSTLKYKGHGSEMSRVGKVKTIDKDTGEEVERDMFAHETQKKYEKDLEVTKNLQSFFDAYDNTENSWIKRSESLIKFIKEYESVVNNPNADKGILKDFEKQYKELQPLAKEREEDFRKILSGAGYVEEIPVVSTEDVANAKQISKTTEVTQEASEQKRIADEASADAAERELKAKKELVKITDDLDDKYRDKMDMGTSVESAARIDPKTGKSDRFTVQKVGGGNLVDNQIDYMAEQKQYIGAHTHPTRVAVPSSVMKDGKLMGDLPAFFERLGWQPVQIIRAMEEVLLLDFSKIAKEDFEKLIDEWTKQSAQIQKEHDDQTPMEMVNKYGNLNEAYEAYQVRLKEAFLNLIKDYNVDAIYADKSMFPNQKSTIDKNLTTPKREPKNEIKKEVKEELKDISPLKEEDIISPDDVNRLKEYIDLYRKLIDAGDKITEKDKGVRDTLKDVITEKWYDNPDANLDDADRVGDLIAESREYSSEQLAKVIAAQDISLLDVVETTKQEITETQKKIETYEELCKTLERLNEIRAKSKQTGDEVNEEYAILERLNATKGESLPGNEISDMAQWGNMLGGNDPVDYKAMAEFLGIEIPQAAEKSEVAVNDVKEEVKELNNEVKKAKDLDDLYFAAKVPLANEGVLESALQDNPDLIAELTAQRDVLKDKLQPVDDTVKAMSKFASINGLNSDQLKQEAANVGRQLSTMYDEGIRGTEEYVALQYKLLNIFKELEHVYGGLKGSGAKNHTEFRNWIADSVEQATGFNPMTAQVVDALWGQDKFSVMKTNEQPFKMREMAALLNDQDLFAELDYQKLSDLNIVIDALNRIPRASETAKQEVDELSASLEKVEQIEEKPSNEVAETNAETEAIEKKTEAVKNLQALVDNANGAHGDNLVTANDKPTTGNTTGVGVNTQELESILNKITYNVKIAHDDTDKTANKIALDDSTLESTLNRVFANIISPATEQNDGNNNQDNGSYALESTLQTVKGVLDNIQAKIGTAEVTTVADDGVLSAIKTAVESINKKIVQGTKVIDTGDKKKEKKSDKPKIKNPKELGNVKATKVDPRVNKLRGLYEDQGIYEAKYEQDKEDERVKVRLKEIEEDIIDLRRQGITLDEEELANIKKKAKQREADDLIAKKANETKKQAVKNEQAALRAQIKRGKEENRVNAAKSSWNAGNKTLEALWKIEDKDLFQIDAQGKESIKLEQVNELISALKDLDDIQQQVNKSIDKGVKTTDKTEEGKALKDNIDKLRAAKMAVDEQNEAVKELISNYTALNDVNTKETGSIHNPNADLRTQLIDAAKSFTDGKAKIGDFDAATGRLKTTVKIGAHEFQEYEFAVRKAGGAIVAVQGTTKKTEKFIDAFNRKIKEFSTYFSAASSIYKVFGWFRKGIQYIREIDSALTELKKVTDETEETYDKFLDTASKTAAKVGSTIKDVVSSTADWARLGYSMKEAAQLAESTQILMNVSEFTNISDATDSLISSIQAFKYTAEESMEVVDILNMIGNNYAISTSDLAKSLTKSSGALVSANNTLEEAVALTAAANTIIQDADVVGTALKTASMRIRGTSIKEMEEQGIDTDGFTSQSKLRSQIKSITGIDILTDTGAYKSTYQILSEISEVWDDITDDKARAGLLELLAGKRSGSVIASILENPETLKNAFEDASKAAGSAIAENEKYLNSIQGRVDLLTNAIQTMWKNTLDDDWIKMFVNLATQLVKLIDNVGGLKVAFMGLGVYLTRGIDFGGFSKPVSESLEQMDENLAEFKDDMDAAIVKDERRKNTKSAQKKEETTKRYNDYAKKVEAAKIANKINKLEIKHNDLIDKRAIAQENYNKANHEFIQATRDGADPVAIEAYSNAANNAKVELQNVDDQLINNGIELEKLNVDMTNLDQKIKQVGDTSQVIGKKGRSAFKKFGAGIKSAVKEIGAFLVKMAAMYAVTTFVDLLGKGFNALNKWGKGINESPEEAQEKFDELNNELSTAQSELRGLESELDKTTDRMDELMSMGTLSLVEQEELRNLQKQSEELKVQIELAKTLEETLKSAAGLAAINASQKTFSQTSFYSEKSKSEREEEAKENGSTWGSAAGMALGLALSFIPGVNIGALALMGAGAFAGGLIGGKIGESSENSEYDSEKSIQYVFDNMRSERAKLEKTRDEAYRAYVDNPKDENLKTQWEDAQAALGNYDTTLAQHVGQMQQYLNSVDPDKLDNPSDKAYYEQMQKWVNNYAVMMGSSGAKTNIIAKLFGEDATGNFAKAREQFEVINAEIKTAQESGDELAIVEAFKKLDNFNLDFLSEEDLALLWEYGLTAHDVVVYFEDQAVAAENAIDAIETYDAIKQISKLTSGVNELKNAFKELHDEGIVSAETLLGLEVNFGHLGDTWKKFFEVMSSGITTMEEAQKAAKDLAEAYVDDIMSSPDGYSKEERLTYIAHLQSLGVTNAREFLDDKVKKDMVIDIAQRVAGGKSQDDAIKEVEELYGIALDGEKDIALIQAAITKEKTEQEAADKRTAKTAYDTAKSEYDGIIRNNKIINDQINTFTTDMQNLGKITPYIGLSDEDEEILKKYGIVEKEGTTASGFGSKIEYQYNGKTYKSLDSVKEVIIKELQSNVQDIPELPVEITASDVKLADDAAESAETAFQDELNERNFSLEIDLIGFDEKVDKVQDVYSTLKNIATEYNSQGHLSLDNLQALLQLTPEYLSVLQMENGQITINQQALQSMLETKLDEAEATAVQTAITQLSALAERKQAIEISNSAVAANQASIQLGTYSSALGTVAQDAIIAAGSVAAFNAALSGAKDNTFVTDDEINQVLNNFNNSVNLIDSVRNNLSSNFNDVLDPESKTSPQEVAESEWDKLISRYERELALITNERDLIEAEIDQMEAQGGKASSQYYNDLIRNSEEEKDLLEEKYEALSKYLEANEDNIDAETWSDYNDELNKTAVAIKECETNTAEWVEAIREIDMHYFDQINDEISRLGDELDFVNSLLEEEEVSDENGNWSSAALTRMGLYTQQMEMAAVETQRYQEQIDELNTQYENGELSEEQYQEKLSGLVSGQQDAIQSYEDAKDGIIQLNEARIDAIKEGIEKEIEAYEDYIDVVKESLDAERDLYDFKKNVKKQTKDIASLERRIASLSSSTNVADIAEKRKLEAELLEAREELNDTYYDHSYDQQSQALDNESEAFSKSKEKYIEQLEEQLKDTETLIQNSMMDVLLNADSIYAELDSITDTYGIALSSKLTKPWEDASIQAKAWKDELQLTMTSGEYAALIGEGGAITAFANGVATKLSGSWNSAQNTVKSYSDFLTGTELGNKFSNTITKFGDQIQTIIDKWNGVKTAAEAAYEAQNRQVTVGGVNTPGSGGSGGDSGGGDGGSAYSANVAALQEVLNTVFNAGIRVDGLLGKDTINAIKKAQRKMNISEDGSYGPQTRSSIIEYIDNQIASWKRSSGSSSAVGQGIQAFTNAKNKLPLQLAKGTMGLSKDQLAITDESWIGEEITLAAGKNGQLQYLKKGSAVMPADISANLIEWGKLNPNMLNVGGGANINMISNAVTKPELSFEFDSLVHVDNCSQETLKDLEKMVDNKINQFSKQMNYAIKRIGGR